MKNKKAQLMAVGVIGLLVLGVVAVGLMFLSYRGGLVQQTALGPGVPVEIPKTAGGQALCPDSGVTLTLSSFDWKVKDTATGETHTVWEQNGVGADGKASWAKKGTVADAGTTTVGGGKQVLVMYGNNSESFHPSAFYPSVKVWDIGCTDQLLRGHQKDRNSTAVTLSLFNSANTGQENNGATTEAIGAGAVQTMLMKLRTSQDDYFGDDGTLDDEHGAAILLTFDMNSSAYDNIQVGSLTLLSAPSSHKGIADSRAVAYELPELFGTTFVQYDVTLDADDTVDPNRGANVTITGYDKCLYINADTSDVLAGYNDEDGNDLCAPQISGVIAVS